MEEIQQVDQLISKLFLNPFNVDQWQILKAWVNNSKHRIRIKQKLPDASNAEKHILLISYSKFGDSDDLISLEKVKAINQQNFEYAAKLRKIEVDKNSEAEFYLMFEIKKNDGVLTINYQSDFPYFKNRLTSMIVY